MKSYATRFALLLIVGVLSSSLAFAADESTAPFGLDVSGWVSVGATWNATASDDFNGPVTFNDYADEGQLDQAYLVIERAAQLDGWDVGGRVDLMYGRDASYTTSVGFDDQLTSNSNDYNIAIPQAYLEVTAPVGSGLSVKVGHFYTLLGYEVVTAPDNFFYSHAYSMQYAEPFTHWGGLATYSLSDSLSVVGGVVRGFDNLSDGDSNVSFLGGVTYGVSDDTTLVFSLVSGNEGRGRNQTVYSVVLTHALSESLSYVLQHDLGVHEGQDALASEQWYSLNNYFLYHVSDALDLGLRLEWFRDDDGARVAGLRSGAGGVAADYYGVSVGANYTLCENLLFRPEVRYDVQDADSDASGKAFDNGQDDQQLLVSGNLLLSF
jgi:hypothetical protein